MLCQSEYIPRISTEKAIRQLYLRVLRDRLHYLLRFDSLSKFFSWKADFRQAWHEAMAGQTIPVPQLWEGLEDD